MAANKSISVNYDVMPIFDGFTKSLVET